MYSCFNQSKINGGRVTGLSHIFTFLFLKTGLRGSSRTAESGDTEGSPLNNTQVYQYCYITEGSVYETA
jgi:hypothetical protein